MSKKFTAAQRAYPTYEQEALGVIEALMKWEDRLVGRPIRLVTDHEAFITLQKVMRTTRNARLIRWDEFISKFQVEIEHVPGATNKVADCLSRYYENDHPDEIHPVQVYVNADVRLEPERSELTRLRQAELDDIEYMFALRERVESREEEAAALSAAAATRDTRI
ncbi:hypothetical protein NUW54_g12247 [Trametes sanguinea]|uniref:Uncharacterized protein n=1 Tax=Trametes sanguinea TaxID=158606 RepID=A0ACC1MZX7_9APHY|nr:hypothetical protein NUW54_g12247 [Trametes sanguinea]